MFSLFVGLGLLVMGLILWVSTWFDLTYTNRLFYSIVSFLLGLGICIGTGLNHILK